MSALSRRAALPRAIVRTPPTASSTFHNGRTAAYRRLTTQTLRHNPVAPSRRDGLFPGSSSRLPLLPALATSLAFRRHISFREMREAKAEADAKGPPRPGSKPDPKPRAANTAKAAPAEPKAEEQSSAEEVFERLRAESAKAEAKQRTKREAQSESESAGEGEAGPDGEKAGKKDKAPPPPLHGNKTPWQVFTETLSSEFKASKEWNEGTKELGGAVHDFTQNPNVQRARSAYTKAAETASTTTSAALKTTASAIGSSAAWTWDTSVVKGVRKSVNVVGSGLDKVTRPVRETEAYKNVKDVIDDGSSSRYGGWTEKEERRRRREAKEMREAGPGGKRRLEPMEEDPNAGVNVTLHKDAAWKESWRDFRDSSKFMQRVFSLKSTYNESENPLISTARSISDRVAGFFAENETAMVIKKFREMDPGFQLEPFLQEMREYILPEVLDAYVKGDVETLKLWLSAAQFQVYAALMKQYTQHGLKSDGRILDIRNVDVLNARMLEPGDIPVFVIMCRTQEVHVYRNAKTGQLASGMEDKVQQVTYAIGITRLPEDVSNPETRGWRLIELQKSGRDYI